MSKFQLQRIESTLSQLNGSTEAAASPQPSPPSGRPRSLQGYSFRIAASSSAGNQACHPAPPFSAQSANLPSLPKFKLPSFSSHHHAANPALAMNLLKTIETKVTTWQTELQQTMRQIHALYEEGPIIDGWLDTHARPTSVEPSATLRHVEVDRLMDYVQEICQTQPSKVAGESPQTDYRLCGLDADGKLWSRPCPAEQLPQVSLAIARYQKLRQLLARKQQLENQLQDLAQTLIPIQSHLQSLP